MMMLLIPRMGLNRSISRLPLQPALFLRFKSNTPSQKKKQQKKTQSHLPASKTPKKTLPSEGEWKHLKLHIPGEQVQKDSIKERIPKFPLAKENVPTLLPRPGVPQVGKDFTFRQVVRILKNKTSPELIYESEPHRLYFFMCFCGSIVFAVYGCVLFEWAFFVANKEYEENEKEQKDVLRRRDWAITVLMYLAPAAVLFALAYGAITFPTRMIRRIYYLPGPVEHIKFTSYPLIPGRATPVYTVPLENLSRRRTARVWTGKGFYGTSDSSLFYFVLNEKLPSGSTKSWVVDRKGFFWSDGRVFDYLFGKETLEEAEAGVPYDEQFGIINREMKKKRKQLKEEHGFFWRYKMAGQEFEKDVRKLLGFVTGDNKKLPPPKDKK
ncbi:hypothetical protein Cantr_08536 [Candida viswanathii]|uniref:Uncharacterized protein n=1 Tax=Candida viswanathii TaxID=5486 RepID=A0A367Y396_9ASCO|nr:hypothetical protein Cantr_08536 [Candida viswanathii]